MNNILIVMRLTQIVTPSLLIKTGSEQISSRIDLIWINIHFPILDRLKQLKLISSQRYFSVIPLV